MRETSFFTAYRKEVSSILKRDGIRGLYRGMLYATMTQFPTQALFLSTYNIMKTHMDIARKNKEAGGERNNAIQSMFALVPATVAPVIAGASAECTSMLVWVPQDVVTQNIQVHNREPGTKYLGGVAVTRNIVRTEGVRGLYRVTAASILTYAPSSGIWWGTYELSKKLMGVGRSAPINNTASSTLTATATDDNKEVSSSNEPGLIKQWASGGIAGTVVSSFVSVYVVSFLLRHV